MDRVGERSRDKVIKCIALHGMNEQIHKSVITFQDTWNIIIHSNGHLRLASEL